MPWTAAVGDSLQDGAAGTVPTAEVRDTAAFVGLYFSAHWCPPCRQFTPVLAACYSEHLKAAGVEIIFVSSDRSASSFDEYYGTMPWKAMPFTGNRAAVGEKYKVNSIPKLVFLHPSGAIITEEGRDLIQRDPSGGKLLAALQAYRLDPAGPPDDDGDDPPSGFAAFLKDCCVM